MGYKQLNYIVQSINCIIPYMIGKINILYTSVIMDFLLISLHVYCICMHAKWLENFHAINSIVQYRIFNNAGLTYVHSYVHHI